MNTIQINLGGGDVLVLPTAIVAEKLLGSLQQTAPAAPTQPAVRHRIGEYLPGQGGIYAGDILGDDGALYGLVIAEPKDVGKAAWGADGERDLSEWDGRGNTKRLRNECPAAKLASDYEADGHCDFYLPARREMMVALANVPHLFERLGWHWTSTPCLSSYAWAVDFEGGSVVSYRRHLEHRVRPFRRFALQVDKSAIHSAGVDVPAPQ